MPFTEKEFSPKELEARLKRLEATTIQQHLCCDRVATLLDVTPRWVQQRVTAGEFVGSRTNGKLLVNVASVNQYLEERRVRRLEVPKDV